MKRVKRAIGYVCEIPIPGTNQVISKEDQKARITKWAQRENVEVFTIIEDNEYCADVLSRPGIKNILDCNDHYDMVLCERIWAFCRKKKELDAFLTELDKRDVQLTASSYMWDLVSQQVRHRYAVRLADRAKKEAEARAEAKSLKVVA